MKDMDVKMTALIEDTSRWILPDLAPNGTYSAIRDWISVVINRFGPIQGAQIG